MVQEPTFVAELTPPGRAAVAVVAVAGPSALEAVERAFHSASGRVLDCIEIGRVCYGRWGAVDGEDVVVVRKPSDGTQFLHIVEVHCHGGVVAVRNLIATLMAAGCTVITWRRWLELAEPDPIRRAALASLANAPTARTTAILLDQVHGALTLAIDAALSTVRNNHLAAATVELDALLQFSDVGLHLTRPWGVVLTGPPNVGKSSLINALVGFERAIVSPTPGTTRDVVTAATAIDGWPVELADTAGVRVSEDELESAGVRLAAETSAAADLVVQVQDAREVSSMDLTSDTAPANGQLLVLNKTDLVRSDERRAEGLRAIDAVRTSALTGAGIAELVDAIGTQLVPQAPPVGAAVPFTSDQVAALQRGRRALEAGNAGAAEQELHSIITDS